jgi:GH15 family glucan-1,4-alpha-glucosidase
VKLRPNAHRLREDGYCHIEDYALIGDGVTAALVALDGSIDWACFPRFDSPSVFGRILDARKGGYWQIAPAGPFAATRRYLDKTNILETSFATEKGDASLIDFMPVSPGVLGHPWDSAIVRILRGRRGTVTFRVVCEPRFEYGGKNATMKVEEGGGVRAVNEHIALTLQTNQSFHVTGNHAEAECSVAEGEDLVFFLIYRREASLLWRQDLLQSATQLLEQTEMVWRHWVDRCTYRGPYREVVERSALALKLLDYAPTGAILAAATTSLPEKIGGVRNWDYRYSWIRDTAFVLYALYAIGYQEEGESFLGWMLDNAKGDPRKLQVLYGVGGEREVPESELDHLEGYRQSRPVRIGNGAYDQLQLDIYGDLVDSAFLLHKHGGHISDDLWEFIRKTVHYVTEIWTKPDEGIWEVRSEPRHFVYSKTLCWVALDRGIKLAERLKKSTDLGAWRRTRDEMFEQILREGYDEEIGAFTQAYGVKDLDAAALAIQLRKLLPADDERMRSTVDRVAQGLGKDGLIHRYLADDGLPGGEGVFLMCSFWLVDCYAEAGRVTEAEELFHRLLDLANDVKLYSEEFDPEKRHFLGNFPQAFTHIALINAAVSLQKAKDA